MLYIYTIIYIRIIVYINGILHSSGSQGQVSVAYFVTRFYECFNEVCRKKASFFGVKSVAIDIMHAIWQ